MSAHTPGPWKAHRTTHARSGLPEFEIHWSADGECVAEIVHGEADARLIALAPEMLEALKDAYPHIENDALRSGIGALIIAATGAA